MTFNRSGLRGLRGALLAAGLLLAALAPAQAAVSTVYNCPSSGNNGNHDNIFNGFYVQNLAAVNLHTVTLYYSATESGTYTLTLTARKNSYAGQVIGTLTQTVSLSASSDKAVTWNFGDAPFTSGASVYFTHTQSGGGGSVRFNLQPDGTCAGNVESVGTSSTDNGFDVAVAITQNPPSTPNSCVASSTTLCIDDAPGDKRFQIRVTYSTSQAGGLSGSGHAVPLASLGFSKGGVFWFFDSTNPEMLIKVLDGCPINSNYWVYFSAGTNVGFHVTVTDTVTGNTADYTNADLHPAAPVQDVTALTCVR